MSEINRVIVFGIDGGTWDIILPMVRQGRLPAFSNMMQKGLYGVLASTIPYASFPAWTTAITGVNPARHGITDFTRRIPGRDGLMFLNSRHRGVPTIFNILSRRNRKVAALGIPCTSPPDPINGIMIGGFDCPVAVSARRSMLHPPQLASELFRKFGGYPYGSISEFRITPDWYSRARSTLLRNIEKRESIFRWLWEQEPWDLFWMVFPETDTASHHFWSLHDPQSPRHDPQLAQEFSGTIEEIYQRLDSVLQSYLEGMSNDDVLIVMSDHGFGGAGAYEMYLNLWLEQEGYMHFKAAPGRARQRQDMIDIALRVLPNRMPQWLFRKGIRWMGSLESRRRLANIDWNRTLAFSEESNSFPGIWCRLRGRDSNGTVPAEDRDRLLNEIRDKLLGWRNPFTGKPVVEHVFRREEVFNGSYVSLIPDLVLVPALVDGYSYAVSKSNHAIASNPIQELALSKYRGGKGSGFSGTHRQRGIFLAVGDGIEAGEVNECGITDISPTILQVMNEEIPQWMEGLPITSKPLRPVEMLV
jgi:predicted AlkP superfamily phosphohydrolase/phosphomutase